MTRIGRRLIEDFLLPALDDERYGDLLRWIDRDKRYFSIRWSHKNAAKWTLADTAVFQDWDKLKGHYHPEIKGYYMQAKQRFRAALYKLNTVRKLPCEDKHVKKYQLIVNPDKRNEMLSRKVNSRLTIKEENQKSIPTPVICRNMSFIAKKERNYEESYSPPSSPASSVKSESSDKIEELERCLKEYQLAQVKQFKQTNGADSLRIPKLEYPDCPPTILRESPNINIVHRPPHLPIIPVPVYNKCNLRQTSENAPKRFESPHVLLVRTYNDTDEEMPSITEKEAIVQHCPISSQNTCSPESALNLSVKTDDEALSR